jgi:hypothetical protein
MSQSSPSQKSAWGSHIRAQKESDLTQQAYCRQHDLKPHQFWYWKNKLGGADSIKPQKQNPSAKSAFIPVVTPALLSRGLSITLPSGISINGIESHNMLVAEQLARVLT